jgi:DNA-binding CsgD family transcriptional regulator
MRVASASAMVVITPGELDVLQMLSNGATVRAIADRLDMGEPEADAALGGLFARLGAASQVEAVAMAIRRGLVASTTLLNGSPAEG